MVKSTNFLSKTFFDYLGKEKSAIFLAYTNLYLEESFDDGIVWIQTDENDCITAVIATGEKEKCLLFVDKNADFDELSFVVSRKFTSADILPYKKIDKKYLLCRKLDFAEGKKGIGYKDFAKIKALDGSDFSENADHVAMKMFFNLKGKCEGVLITENGENVSGGFISFGNELSVITDVFTKDSERGRGYGKALLEKLLNCSIHENVYLTSKEHNLEFYKKLGFEVVKEIYEYTTEDN